MARVTYHNRHAFLRTYSANLPSSLRLFIPDTPDHSLAGAPVSVLGTNVKDCSGIFFTGSWRKEKPNLRPAYSRLIRVLVIATLPQIISLEWEDNPTLLSRKRYSGKTEVAYLNSAGILTCFPFGHHVLELPLGSTNPQLTNIAEEP